jgi:hypothetical protein
MDKKQRFLVEARLGLAILAVSALQSLLAAQQMISSYLASRR